MALNLSDEYTIEFTEKPFGMNWGSRKTDRKNLYVTGIDKDSPAYYLNVIMGSKLIKFGEQNIENLGAKEIFWHYKNNHDDTLPLKITFRKPKPKKSKIKTATSPISRATKRAVSVYQNFAMDESQKVPPIKFPVDCDENAMKYSVPARLQENFIVILEYMATNKNTQDEWTAFLSHNDYEVLTRFAKTTKRLLEAEMEEFSAMKDHENDNDDNKQNDDEEEDAEEEKKASAFGWLCVILSMFGNLSIEQFVELITEYTLNNVITSMSNHTRLTRQDCVNRLDLLLWILVHNHKLTDYLQSDEFVLTLCGVINENKYKDVIEMASKSLIYAVSRRHKADIKESLLLIQHTLSGDAFRKFTEYYFDVLNNIDFTVDDGENELELLIEFNAFVFRYNLYTFYFESDIKVLIEIYLRMCSHCEPSSKHLLLTLDGLYNILRWKHYADAQHLNKHKLQPLIDVLSGELKKNVQDSYKEYKQKYDHFDDDDDDAKLKYKKSELGDILKMIQLINRKMNTIVETLHAIKDDEYDYEKQQSMELAVDISEYSLKTKSMKQLQTDLIELLYFLSQSLHTPQEWISFLSDNEFEVYKRLCVLAIRLLQNESKFVKAMANHDGNDNEAEKKIDLECELDVTQLFPLSTLCQLLVMFATLSPDKFMKMIKLRVLNPLRASLKYADKLSVKDVQIRLRVLLFCINHDESLEIAVEWFRVLCDLLTKREDDDGDDGGDEQSVLRLSTQCITFFIGKMADLDKQREFVVHLQQNLKGADDFRHFVECYVKLINEIKMSKWNEATTKLLVNFVIAVMQQQLQQFFFLSDLKVLIEIYLRCLQNIDDNAGLLLCLHGIQALFQWNAYRENDDDEESNLKKYKYDEIVAELNQKLEIMKENENQNEEEVVALIQQILKIHV